MKKMKPREQALLRIIANRDKLDPIQRMGVLRALIESPMMQGTQAQRDWQLEAQQLALWAQTNLTPEQLHRANLLAEQSKHEWIEHARRERAANINQEEGQRVEQSVREMTHGMLGQPQGISRAQLGAIRDGKDIPREHMPRFSQAAMDAHWKKVTRRYDPAGRGWGEKEAVRRLDALVDAPPERFAAEARNFRGDIALLRKEAKNWDENRIGYGLIRRRVDRDIQLGRQRQDTHEPNDRDRRRAAVVDAYLKTTADAMDRDSSAGEQSETYREFAERVPDNLLNEEHDGKPTRRAQIARAMVEQEADGEADWGE
jgi:hypothetical protein